MFNYFLDTQYNVLDPNWEKKFFGTGRGIYYTKYFGRREGEGDGQKKGKNIGWGEENEGKRRKKYFHNSVDPDADNSDPKDSILVQF